MNYSMDVSLMGVDELIPLLHDPNSFNKVLIQLVKASKCSHPTCNQKTCRELASKLWGSFGIAFLLLEEVISVYKKLEPSKLTKKISKRVCNVLVLLQCMASEPEVRAALLKATIPSYVYPLLQTTAKGKHFSCIKLASLGVIGALLKCDPGSKEAEISVRFLLESEVLPCCLQCMEKGDELVQEVATAIVWKILLEEEGLQYCCVYADRFFSVVQVLNAMVEQLAAKPNVQLMRRVVHCFLRFSEAPRAIGFSLETLRAAIPTKLRNDTFGQLFHENPDICWMVRQLCATVPAPAAPTPSSSSLPCTSTCGSAVATLGK